ncbi:MAG: DMT family transporter [Bacteroidales bacterium]
MEAIKKMNEPFKGHLALLATNIIFGANASISKLLLIDHMNAYALSLIRMLSATALFWGASFFAKREKIERKDFFMLFLASIFGILLNQGLFVIGLSKTSPIDAILLETLTPVMTMIIAALYLKEPITFKKAIGVIIGCSGAVLLILRENHSQSGISSNMWGNILVLISGLAYATYFAVFIKIVKKYSPITVMKWMFLFSSIICTPFWFKDIMLIDFTQFSTQASLQLSFTIVFATFLTYLMLPIGQKRLRPTIVSMYIYCQPIVVTIVSIMLGVGSFSWDKVLATVLIFIGVYVVTQSKSRQQVLEEQEKLKTNP